MTAHDLIEKIRQYNSAADARLIERAYVFAERKHEGQKRKSGDEFFTHPLAVAEILADHMQEDRVIAAGLLHDTVEDTDTSNDEIAAKFGRKIAAIVNGVTKVEDELKNGARTADGFSEFMRGKNFRKFISAAGRHNNVMMVKCADRLHNLKTSQSIPFEKKLLKARETIDIYAPLAEMCGFQKIRKDLEDAAFAILRPDERNEILRKYVVLRGLKQDPSPEVLAAQDFHTQLLRKLKAAKIDVDVSGRLKSPYSIWRKYRSSIASAEIGGEETRPVHEWLGSIFDVFGFRIVTGDVVNAYQVLRIVHTNWRALPHRFKDYISTPKEVTNYQAIHTAVELPVTGAVEIQIRTAEMHVRAEYGSAAHWAYRDGVVVRENDRKDQNALQILIDETMWSKKGEISDSEFKKKFSRAVTVRQISIACYTPKGRMIRLPSESTALDFAFAVHSKMGERAIAAKVAGRRVELHTMLSDGDRVEIITAIDASPKQEWMEWVKTARAKAEIRRSLQRIDRQQLITLGLKIADEALKSYGREANEKVLKIAAESVLDTDGNVEQLLLQLGRSERRRSLNAHEGHDGHSPDLEGENGQALRAGVPRTGTVAGSDEPDLTAEEFVRAVLPETFLKVDPKVTEPENFFTGLPDDSDPHIAPCCLPIPREEIVGVARKNGRLRVHRVDCKEIPWGQDGARIVQGLNWHEGPFVPIHPVAITASLTNRAGVLGRICNLIGEQNSNISDLLFLERKPKEYRILFEVQVRDCTHLDHVLSAMRTDLEVKFASRCANAHLLKKAVLKAK